MTVWLVNTGQNGEGERVGLEHTRAIVEAINNGKLKDVKTNQEEFFGLHVPEEVEGVPDDILNHRRSWGDSEEDQERYKESAKKLVKILKEDMKDRNEGRVREEVLAAGPR